MFQMHDEERRNRLAKLEMLLKSYGLKNPHMECLDRWDSKDEGAESGKAIMASILDRIENPGRRYKGAQQDILSYLRCCHQDIGSIIAEKDRHSHAGSGYPSHQTGDVQVQEQAIQPQLLETRSQVEPDTVSLDIGSTMATPSTYIQVSTVRRRICIFILLFIVPFLSRPLLFPFLLLFFFFFH